MRLIFGRVPVDDSAYDRARRVQELHSARTAPQRRGRRSGGGRHSRVAGAHSAAPRPGLRVRRCRHRPGAPLVRPGSRQVSRVRAGSFTGQLRTRSKRSGVEAGCRSLLPIVVRVLMDRRGFLRGSAVLDDRPCRLRAVAACWTHPGPLERLASSARGPGAGSTGQFGNPRDERLYNVTEEFRAYDGQAEAARRQRHAEELPELAPASPGVTTTRCFGRWPGRCVELPFERTLCHASSMEARTFRRPSGDRRVHPRQVAGAAVRERHTPAASPDKNQGVAPARSERGHRRRAPRSPWA